MGASTNWYVYPPEDAGCGIGTTVGRKQARIRAVCCPGGPEARPDVIAAMKCICVRSGRARARAGCLVCPRRVNARGTFVPWHTGPASICGESRKTRIHAPRVHDRADVADRSPTPMGGVRPRRPPSVPKDSPRTGCWTAAALGTPAQSRRVPSRSSGTHRPRGGATPWPKTGCGTGLKSSSRSVPAWPWGVRVGLEQVKQVVGGARKQ